MKRQQSKWLGVTAWMAPLALAVLMSGWGGMSGVLGQTAGPTTRPTTQPAPLPGPMVYTLEARPEIAKLKPAPANPKSMDDLKAIQARVEAVARQALPATVGLQMGDGQGSGVIVSKDGYVLTAGHVSGTPGDRVTIVLSNGAMVAGHSLGANNWIDSGMVKIDTPGAYPFMPVGSAAKLETGQWVIAMGHPGGYQVSRPPVVRLGRILNVQYRIPPNTPNPSRELYAVTTDSTLINGDSGGPLFDLDGRVVGINSRIGPEAVQNIHVPVDTFLSTWDRLAKGDEWDLSSRFAGGPRRGGGAGGAGRGGGGLRGGGGPGGLGGLAGGANAVPTPATPVAPAAPATPRLGITVNDNAAGGAVVTYIAPGTSADGVDLRRDDVITKFNGRPVKTGDDLAELATKLKPGDSVTLDVLRGNQPKTLSLKVGSGN